MAATVPAGPQHSRLRKAPDSGVHPALPRAEKAARTKANDQPAARKRIGARSTRSRG